MIKHCVPITASLVIALLSLSCTRVAYPGPRLPNESVATVQPDRTMLYEIDGAEVPEELARRRVDFQLSPGRHVIGIAVHDYHHGFLARRLVYSTGVKICLEAEAGRTYLARALVEGQRWQPEMLDGATMKPVPINCSAKPDDEDPAPIRR
jgi:hypothetical protein